MARASVKLFLMLICHATGVTPSSVYAQELRVVASFSILADMVSEAVGDAVIVDTIVGPGTDAHTYRPSVADAMAVANADLIFVNGLGFETWLDKLITESGADAVVCVVSEGVSPVVVDGGLDPHAWNSLVNGVFYVRNIASCVSQAAPSLADLVTRRAGAYIQELETMDREFRNRVNKLPESNRTVVTSHDAFGYLAADYDLVFLSAQGVDTEGEPTSYDLAVLIQELREAEVVALFIENIGNSVLVDQIARETGLVVGGRLYSDALSHQDGPASTYTAMFKNNMNMILEALEHSS